MIACPGCGFEAPDDFAFCPKCATALTVPRAIPEERKVVTTLFCDLVAFTAMSETADPEDVDALLGEYFARARKAIESHGGTIEKFIGDAVVGVFGVPAVHEDDPERAVRAALRILEALEGMTRADGTPLEARCGVNTGEALVRLDVDPASGRGFLTGDAVNTAARLEAAALPGGVAVGALTHSLTERVIAYEELPAVNAKGKSAPVAAWLAKAPVSRLGTEATVTFTPLVGRDAELAYLIALLDKSFAESTPQMVLLVGEPGIGKSRLIIELMAHVDARPYLVTWRQGRCPAYGESATFWALGEIVKAHAGVLETDGEGVSEAKLEVILPEGEDRDWFRQRLRPLLGLEAPTVDPEVNHTAWLRFFEDLAGAGPTVLVFEDLHWADQALLAFLEHLASHAAGVPLMVVGTARPQLFEEHPGFLANAPRSQRIGLERLSANDTSRLVEALIEGAGLRASSTAEIVRRVDGNPFYAEESARLLMERADASQLPATVQAVIAARLDALPTEHKTLLGNAAVVGEVFWSGALAALGSRERTEVDGVLRRLVEKQLVRRIRTSSMAGEQEFSFAHGLARDVSYQALPRAVRAARHLKAAAWLDDVASEREDLADVLAHHYVTAHELFHASGDQAQAELASGQAVRYLSLAGERAKALDVQSAERHFSRALALTTADDERRPLLLLKWAQTLNVLCTDDDEGIAALTEAIPALLAQGDVRRGALGMTELNFFLERRCEWDPQLSIEALELLTDDEPSPELIIVAPRAAMCRWWIDREQRHLLVPELHRILEIAGALGLPMPVEAVMDLGVLRCSLGDAGGLDDARRAVESAREQGLGEEFVRALLVYTILLASVEGPLATLRLSDEALEFCERRGMRVTADMVRGMAAESLALCGAWDEALAAVTAAAGTLDEVGDTVDLMQMRSQEAMLRCWRGDLEAALALAQWLEERRGLAKPMGLEVYCLGPAALASYLHGDRERALALLTDIEIANGYNPDARYAELLTDGMRVALQCGSPDTAASLVEGLDLGIPIYEHILATAGALLSEARCEHEAAAEGFAVAAARWHDFGVPYEEGQALLGQGRCLAALGRAREAAAPLTAAREIFARLGAKPALAETDDWLRGVGAGAAQ